MRRTVTIILGSIVAILLIIGAFAFFYLQGTITQLNQPGRTPAIPQHNMFAEKVPDTLYSVEPFVQNLLVPWGMVFTSGDRLLVTERPGRIRVVLNGELQAEPLHTFPEVTSEGEDGLMGITLGPDYENNKYIYLCLAYEKEGKKLDKVIRLTDEGSQLIGERIVLDDIPIAQFHAGCRIRFAPDDTLYITTGDAQNSASAQDLSSLAGKILRVHADGSIPADNPFGDSPIYSYGHRNPQGLDWHPLSKILISSEHGPTGGDGPGGGDEVNLIEAGGNYGWPLVSHNKTMNGMIGPLLVFTPAIAPASGMFYSGSTFLQLKNNFLVGMLKGEGILRVSFDQSGQNVAEFEPLPAIAVGRVRDVIQGPDGLIYFATSNRDGRGSVRDGDDQIYRLVPRR